ncbi:hypothetical protein WMY93_005898 [Mugilogobius chulae]|uniref:Uncharacterized protein n=1 Tax=Mugilogobius chulae TaxID=88201 RepID=A0AAW0PPJ3_9GOBI
MISMETQTKKSSSNQPLPCESDYVKKIQKEFERYKCEIENDLATREAEWTEVMNKLKSEKDAWCKEANTLSDEAKNLKSQISETQHCLEEVVAEYKGQLDKWNKTEANAFPPKMISMETQTEEDQEKHSVKDLQKKEQAWKAEKAELLRQIDVMKSWDVQPTSLTQVESSCVRARNYIDQEVQFGLFKREHSWVIEKRNMENQIQELSQLNQALDTKVKDHWLQLQEKTTSYDGNEKAFIHKETDLLRKITELSNKLTEKREQEITWMKDLDALKSQLAKKENQLLLSETEMDAKTMTWLNEKGKFENERKKFEDEKDDLNKVTLLNRLTEQLREIEELKLQQTQLIENNRKWKENFNSYCERKAFEFKEEEEIWHKQKLQLENESSKKNYEIQKLQTIIARLEGNLQRPFQKKDQIEKLQETIYQLQQQVVKRTEICNDSELKQQQEIWTNEKLKLAEECSKKNAEMEKLRAKIEELENALATEQQKCDDLDSELKQQQENWTKEKVKLTEDCSQKNDEIAKLRAKIEELGNALVTEQQKNRDDIISELNHQQEIWKNDKLKLKERLLEKIDKLKTKMHSLKRCLRWNSKILAKLWRMS